MSLDLDASSSRREFLKSAVALGGMSALAACVDRDGKSTVPTGTESPEKELPSEQHAWNEYLLTDDHGNPKNARHHILRFMSLPDDGTPSEGDREAVRDALKSLEEAYEWSPKGVLFTIGYSPSYFDRFDDDLPESVDLPEEQALAEFEEPEFDDYDAVLHLASNDAQAIIEAEAGLFGDADTMNGQDVSTRLTDVFDASEDYPARRTGFVGAGLPKRMAKKVGAPADKIPEDAPLFMGFKSGFQKNQASESRVTIDDGPFAGGTTQHISALDLNLNQWWNQDDRWQRIAKMFAPTHADEDLIEGVGGNLGTGSKMDETMDPKEAAMNFGLVGHSQKMLSAREDDEPLILRRDFDTTDEGNAGLHFLAVHETITDFEETRRAMNGADIAEETPVGQRNNNGILQYLRTHRRGNYLLPPREHYALPESNPE